MHRKRIVIVGSNFAGFTAALTLKELLRSKHDVTVISRSDQFVFQPSLVRIPMGARTAQQASFSVRSRLAGAGVAFRDEPVLRIDLPRRRVLTPTSEERYDFLVIATGARPNYAAVPGLGPRGYTQSIMTLAEAEQAREAFARFLLTPGPVVVGDIQGSACRRPAFELLINMARILEQRGLTAAAPLTHLTSGPPRTVGGAFDVISGAAVAEIVPGQIRLVDGRQLPFGYAMLLPPFLGADVVRACDQITNAGGFVRVGPFHNTQAWPEVFAAGAAAAEPEEKSGYFAEQSGQQVARNIAACILGNPMAADAPPVDVRGVGSPEQGPIAAEEGWLIPGAEAAWSQLAFERYFPTPG